MNHLSIRAKLYSITALISIVLFALGSNAIIVSKIKKTAA